MTRAKGTPVSGIRDPVALVAASLLPTAVLSLPVVRAAIGPGSLVLVLVIALYRRRGTMGLLLAWLFLNLLLILLALGVLLPLFLFLLGLGCLLLLLLLLTAGPLLFFWTGGIGRSGAPVGGGLLGTPRLCLTRGFRLLRLRLWPRLSWLPSGGRRLLSLGTW